MHNELINTFASSPELAANIGTGIIKIINNFNTFLQALFAAVFFTLGICAIFMGGYWAFRKVTADQQQKAQYSWLYAIGAIVLGGVLAYGSFTWFLKLSKSAQASFGNLSGTIDPAIIESVTRILS